MQQEPYNSLAPRFYASPSYAIGDFTLAGRVKYILANGYPMGNVFYDGGGTLMGLEPYLKVPLDPGSSLKISAAFDYVIASNMATDSSLDRVDVDYTHWTFGTIYEVKL